MKPMLYSVLLLCAALIAGCGGSKPEAAGDPAAKPAPAQEETSNNSGHDDPVNLGAQTTGAYTVEVVAYGGVEPGHEGDIDVDIDGGTPKAVRAWVGTEDAAGAVKALAEEEEPGHYHVHVEVGETLPEGAKFWLELEEESGETLLLSYGIL